jgi:tetratricopeptide (TPR) repeat protein
MTMSANIGGGNLSNRISRGRMSALLLLAAVISLSSCSQRKAPSPVEGDKKREDVVPATSSVIFRDAKGRELKEADLVGFTGQFKWEVVGGDNVPEKAQQLHRQGREAGGKGDYDRALTLFAEARKEAPKWPYPVYDAAFTYLLKDDAEKAEEFYAAVDKMAPRGFFTAKTALDCLRREKKGDLEPGTYKRYVMLEWERNRANKKAALEQMVKRSPRFPAAWKELALLQDNDTGKLELIEKGLSHEPDGEVRGILLINKALTLNKQGKRDEAVRILGELALDTGSTLATEHLAKVALANFVKKQ